MTQCNAAAVWSLVLVSDGVTLLSVCSLQLSCMQTYVELDASLDDSRV